MEDNFYQQEKKHADRKLITMAALAGSVVALLGVLTVAIFTLG